MADWRCEFAVSDFASAIKIVSAIIKRKGPVNLCGLTGPKAFGAGSEIQGGSGNELRIVTYVRSRDL
jgi:hypothetical protein